MTRTIILTDNSEMNSQLIKRYSRALKRAEVAGDKGWQSEILAELKKVVESALEELYGAQIIARRLKTYISVTEYARRVGKAPKTIRDKLLHGTLNGVKVGRIWIIDENEPYIDNRIKDGKYINWRRGK